MYQYLDAKPVLSKMAAPFVVVFFPLLFISGNALKRSENSFCTCCFVEHDCVYEACQRLQPLCSQVSHPLTSGREETIVWAEDELRLLYSNDPESRKSGVGLHKCR